MGLLTNNQMEYFDIYRQELMQAKVDEKKATYIAQKICNRMRKQPFCISGIYIEGGNFKIGSKTKESGQLIQETFTTKDTDKIYYQFYFN